MSNYDILLCPICGKTIVEIKNIPENLENIKILREKTGVGMRECKKAICICSGDVFAAEEYLRWSHFAVVRRFKYKCPYCGELLEIPSEFAYYMKKVN